MCSGGTHAVMVFYESTIAILAMADPLSSPPPSPAAATGETTNQLSSRSLARDRFRRRVSEKHRRRSFRPARLACTIGLVVLSQF